MTGPSAAVAATRVAVRAVLLDEPERPVAVGLSGGPDSTALLAAVCFERPGAVTALVVDHHWHDASGQVAAAAADTARRLGAEVVVLAAPGARDEAAARSARYAALESAVSHLGRALILLGHTRDDQAETVLLGLARGSGARSLAGMSARRGPYRRPFLEVPRAVTRQACVDQSLPVYDDPANADRAFARVRVRRDALPALAAASGHDVTVNLARSARLLRDDADLLDALATEAAGRAARDGDALDVAVLAGLPAALRRRVLHRWAGGASAAQVDALEALICRWHGQGPVSLAGGARAMRVSGRIRPVPVTEQS